MELSCGQECQKGEFYTCVCERNLYAYSEETKQAAYVSLVRPHLEYATAVWDPYRQNQVEKLEAVQSHAVRFIDYDNNNSVSKLKKSLSLELLSERRKSHRLQIFHKLVYIDIALPLPPYYKLSIRETGNYLMNSFTRPSGRHDYYKYSFFPRTIRVWNCLLPENIALHIIQHFVEQNYSKFCFKYCNVLVIYIYIYIYIFFFFNFLIYIYTFIS